jgi:hypothetical protein
MRASVGASSRFVELGLAGVLAGVGSTGVAESDDPFAVSPTGKDGRQKPTAAIAAAPATTSTTIDRVFTS